MRKVLNMTQHQATPDQMEAGVVNPDPVIIHDKIKKLLTFDEIPDVTEMERRAALLADIAVSTNHDVAMIGGAPWFMRVLEDALRSRGVIPVYGFSRRVVTETTLPDGSVQKTTCFKHAGFVFSSREDELKFNS